MNIEMNRIRITASLVILAALMIVAARTNFCEAAGIASDWQEGFPSGEDFERTLVRCVDVPDNCFIQETRIWGTAQVPGMVNPF